MRLQEVYEEAEVAGVKIPIPSRVQVRGRGGEFVKGPVT